MSRSYAEIQKDIGLQKERVASSLRGWEFAWGKYIALSNTSSAGHWLAESQRLESELKEAKGKLKMLEGELARTPKAIAAQAEIDKENTYKSLSSQISQARSSEQYQALYWGFEGLGAYKDAPELAEKCATNFWNLKQVEDAKAAAEIEAIERAKKHKENLMRGMLFCFVSIAFVVVLLLFIVV